MPGPSLAEVKAAGQPTGVIFRINDEHWAGRAYMRRVSPGATWVFARLGWPPNAVTGGFIACGVAAGAQHGTGRGDDLDSGRGGEVEEGAPRDGAVVEGQERDPHRAVISPLSFRGTHFTAPKEMPRKKYRCSARNTTIIGSVIRTAPAAMSRVLWANNPDR